MGQECQARKLPAVPRKKEPRAGVLYSSEVDRAASYWSGRLGVKIDPALVHAIIERETLHGRHPTYLRGRGAVLEPDGDHSYGPMQVKGSTARDMGAHPDDLRKPAVGIWYGVQYFGRQLARFAGDEVRAVSAYNAGPGNAKRSKTTGRFPNESYIAAVLGFWKRYGGRAGAVVTALGPIVLLLVAALLLKTRRAGRA